jgi:ankyrin repeat protein
LKNGNSFVLKILLSNNNDYVKYKVLERLFSEGYNPNLELMNKENKTALIVASELNLVDIVKLLLNNKAKPNMSDKSSDDYTKELLIILHRLDEPYIPGNFDLLNYVLQVSEKYHKEDDETMKRIIVTLNKEKEQYNNLVSEYKKNSDLLVKEKEQYKKNSDLLKEHYDKKSDGKRSKKRSKKRNKKIKN